MSPVVGENGPVLDGWHVQPAKHCGQICVDFSCPTCGENVSPNLVTLPANIELGCE